MNKCLSLIRACLTLAFIYIFENQLISNFFDVRSNLYKNLVKNVIKIKTRNKKCFQIHLHIYKWFRMPQQIRYCTVLGCSNSNSQNTISLHHLPSGVKNVDRRKKWREALYLSESERCAVCINHFDKIDWPKEIFFLQKQFLSTFYLRQ